MSQNYNVKQNKVKYNSNKKIKEIDPFKQQLVLLNFMLFEGVPLEIR